MEEYTVKKQFNVEKREKLHVFSIQYIFFYNLKLSVNFCSKWYNVYEYIFSKSIFFSLALRSIGYPKYMLSTIIPLIILEEEKGIL